MNKTYFSRNLKYLIKDRKISLTELADRLEVGKSTVSSYLNNVSYPQVKKLLLIKEIFRVSLDDLFYRDLEMDGEEKFHPAVEIVKNKKESNAASNSQDNFSTLSKEISELREVIKRLEKKLK